MKVLEKGCPVQINCPRLCLSYNAKALKPKGTYTCPGSGPGRGISLGINIPTRMPTAEIMIIIHQDLTTTKINYFDLTAIGMKQKNHEIVI